MLIIHLPFVAATWILTFFFIPETQFRRPDANSGHVDIPEHRADSKENTEGSEVFEEENVENQQNIHPSTNVAKRGYLQNLTILSETYTDISLLKLIAAPFVVLHNQSVIWVSLTQSLNMLC